MQVFVNERNAALHHDVSQFFAALEKYDPFFDPEPAPQENVHSLEVDYTAGAIAIQW
jgi:alpha-glucosidase